MSCAHWVSTTSSTSPRRPLADLVLAATGGRKVDVVIEATGHPPTIVDGLGVLRTAGILVVAGIHLARSRCR